jgi:hypothetical protein
MVVRYLQENGFPRAERRALAGSADKGDVTGIDDVVIEVKGDRSNKISAWKAEAVAEARNAGAEMLLLVVRVDRKPVERWEAHIPWNLLDSTHLLFDNAPEDWQWARIDLRMAAAMLRAAGYH